MIRSIWVVFNLFVISIPLCTYVILLSFVAPQHRARETVPRLWCRWLLRVSGVSVRLEGIEHIAPDRPQVIVPNHVSWYDVLAIGGHMPKRYRFIAKKELADVPLWGRAWQAAGHIPVDRANRQIAVESLDHAGRVVREDGSAIVIFPEGTRSSTGELLPFRKGAFMLALHNGFDIVPTAVIGSRDVLPKSGWRVRPGRIIVRFAAPITTAGCTVEDRDTLIARTQADMQTMIAAGAPHSREWNVDNNQHPRP